MATADTTAVVVGVMGPVCQSVDESISSRRTSFGKALCCGLFLLSMSAPAWSGSILDYIREYDLNDYSLGVSVSSSQNPYSGAPNSTIAYPYLTSFRHSAFTDDWLLIRGENVGVRYITESDWEFGVIGRIQTLGLGGAENDELRGLDKRSWAVEAGPIIGWRRWPVHMQFRSYWEMPSLHDGMTSEIEFSLPRQFARGYFVPAVKVSYLSDDYSRYYFGVADYEATPTREAYQPGAVMNTWLGFSLGYQLTPHWLLSTTVGVEYLDSAVTASPIVDRDQTLSASIGLAYNADLFRSTEFDTEGGPAIEFRMAAMSGSIDTRIIRDAANGEPGDEIDLENALGVADRETIIQLDGFYRVAYYHRLELGFFELQRRSSTILQRDINFGDDTFAAGSDVEINLKSEAVRLAYSYSLMRDQQKELGVTAGLSYSQFETDIQASATQQFERQSVNALLPTVGVFGSLAVGNDWRLIADITAFSLDFEGFEGYMGYLNIGLDRKFGENFAAGAGYSLYGTRLKSKDTELRGTFRQRHYGPKLYLTLSF
jgi:outer membrane scaffolding protein for murein synthesis (MipA/OmpV family)